MSRRRFMMMSGSVAASPPPPSSGVETAAWIAAVIAAGGSVSGTQEGYVNTFIAALIAGNVWNKTDDIGLLVAESSVQALVSLKQLRTGTAVNSPTFTASAGYLFDGATNYINTNFICATHAVAMTPSSLRISIYERTNVGTSTFSGGILVTTNLGVRMRARHAANFAGGAAGADFFTGTTPVLNSQGLTALQRSGPTETIYKTGTVLDTHAATNISASLAPTYPLVIGANSANGVVGTHRAMTGGYWSIGAALSNAESLAEYNAVQAYMTSHGAQV